MSVQLGVNGMSSAAGSVALLAVNSQEIPPGRSSFLRQGCASSPVFTHIPRRFQILDLVQFSHGKCTLTLPHCVLVSWERVPSETSPLSATPAGTANGHVCAEMPVAHRGINETASLFAQYVEDSFSPGSPLPGRLRRGPD